MTLGGISGKTASSGTGSSSPRKRSSPWTWSPRMRPERVLVAGIGNIFLGDDGFGVEVVRRLAERPLPGGVEVKDFGIRGMDLAYALQDDYGLVVFVDATSRGGEPGTGYLIGPGQGGVGGWTSPAPARTVAGSLCSWTRPPGAGSPARSTSSSRRSRTTGRRRWIR